MGVIDKLQAKAVVLKGNELGWLLKFGEEYYCSQQFRNYVKRFKLEKLNDMLKVLMCKFHPNNFSAGDSRTEWLLIKKSDVLAILEGID